MAAGEREGCLACAGQPGASHRASHPLFDCGECGGKGTTPTHRPECRIRAIAEPVGLEARIRAFAEEMAELGVHVHVTTTLDRWSL